MLGAAAQLVAARDVAAPALELGPLRGAIDATLVAEVGDVVDRPAERVDRIERVAPAARQREKGVVEVRAAFACEPGGQAADHAIFLASRA